MRPTIGQTYMLRGAACIIVAVYGFGTIDVCDPSDDTYYRVSGGDWI